MQILLLVIIVVLVVIMTISNNIANKFFKVLSKKGESTITYVSNKENSKWNEYLKVMKADVEWLDTIEREEVEIESFDRIKLHGYLFKQPTKRGVILFHSCKSNGYKEYAPMAKFYFNKGYNVLIVDQRAHGKSEGKFSSLGINESRDAIRWTKYLTSKLGEHAIIYLQGMSMGCTTVLQASNQNINHSVKGIIAENGLLSVYDEIKKQAEKSGFLKSYVLMLLRNKFRARCGIDIYENPPLYAVKETNIPILFIGSEEDEICPVEYTTELYDACKSKKEIYIAEGAPHCGAYYVNPDAYLNAIKKFIKHTL